MKVLVKEERKITVVETTKVQISYDTLTIKDLIDFVLNNEDYGVSEFIEGFEADYLLLLYINECFGVDTQYSELIKALNEIEDDDYNFLYQLLRIDYEIDGDIFTTMSICNKHLVMSEVDKILASITKGNDLVIDTTKTAIINSRVLE